MPILSQRGRLALAVVVDIALAEAPLRQKELTTRHRLSPRFFEPMLQTLAKAGVLRGIRGPFGGYTLARAPEAITCAEVVRAVLETAEAGEFGLLPASIEMTITPLTLEAERDYFDRLERISIAALCTKAEALDIIRSLKTES